MKSYNIYLKLFKENINSFIKSNELNLELNLKNSYLYFKVYFPILVSFDNSQFFLVNNEIFYFKNLKNVKIKVAEFLYSPNDLEQIIKAADLFITSEKIEKIERNKITLFFQYDIEVRPSQSISIPFLFNIFNRVKLKNLKIINLPANTSIEFTYDVIILYQSSEPAFKEISLSNEIIYYSIPYANYFTEEDNKKVFITLKNDNITAQEIIFQFLTEISY